MKALILKDLFSLKKHVKWTLLTILFFLVISFVFENGLLLIALAFIFGTIQVTAVFQFDEMSSWDKFANTLPISKADIVKSKYLLGILFSVAFILIITPVVFISNALTTNLPVSSVVSILCLVVFGSLFILSILLPVYINFGTQKGRILLFSIVFLPIFSMGFIVEGISNLQVKMSLETVLRLGYISPIFAIATLVISYLISINVYTRKEY